MSEQYTEETEKKKLDCMKVRILKLERDNLKTHEKTNDAMVECIRKIIITEADRSF